MAYELPPLPYDYSALEPVISREIMELHHKKHHQAYINNFNATLEKYEAAMKQNDAETMLALQGALKFNGGGHINHSIFWQNLAPQGEGGEPSQALRDQFDKDFGSFDKFKEEMTTKTAAVQGSGWGWLAYDKAHQKLVVATCVNQDPVHLQGVSPLFGIDVWEHAYYLQYKNVRPDYVKNIWNIANWNYINNCFNKLTS